MSSSKAEVDTENSTILQENLFKKGLRRKMSDHLPLPDPEEPVIVTYNRDGHKAEFNDSVSAPVPPPIFRATPAVKITNLTKRYTSNGPPVIDNLCMTVRKGTIYGLLGSSGCGKTTVLSCIVGLKKWDSGEIRVFGHEPGTKESGIPGKRLGYMPQDLALYEQLTIREMMQFYARLYNMPKAEAAERWLFLIKLLKLPSKFMLIGNLSGGQKRRASLALALVYCPNLLILDEPTVGLDPLLRRSIWNHLYKIVSTLKSTIIITTHYIEEARLAHSIGVMRKGRLLVENSPTNLLHHFDCKLLEEVVLKLCRRDESTIAHLSTSQTSAHSRENPIKFTSAWGRKEDVSNVLSHDEIDGIFRKTVGFDCEINENLRRKRSLQRKDSFLLRLGNNPVYESLERIQGFMTVMWLTFMRNPIFIGMLLLLPAVHGTLSLLTLGAKPVDMRFGVVNQELFNWTVECPGETNETSCDFSVMSCKYLSHLKKTDLFQLLPYSSVEDAVEEVHKGNLWGYMLFPANFSQDTFDFAAAKHFAQPESIEGSRIHVQLDMSQYVGSLLMIKELFNSYQTYIKDLAESCNIGGRQTEIPLFFRDPVYGTNDDNFVEYIAPGILISCVFGILGCLAAVMIISDYKRGMMSRAHVAGLSNMETMISHLITQTILVLGQIALWTLILRPFGIVVLGSSWLYWLILVGQGWCGAVFGLLLGAVTLDEVAAMIVGIFIMPFLLIYGGVLWPLDGLPATVKYLGNLLPSTLPSSSLRSVITRGVGLTHDLVWPGIVIELAWTVGLCLLAVIALRRVVKV